MEAQLFKTLYDKLEVIKNDGHDIFCGTFFYGKEIEFKSSKDNDYETIEITSISQGLELTDEQIEKLVYFAWDNQNNIPEVFAESDNYFNCGVKPSDFF